MSDDKICDFRDLIAWQKGHGLVLSIYRITKSFPTTEKYGLINQMRRCSVSITSNIAEGFSRRSVKEKTQFFHISLGSITELQNQLLISKDIDYINETACNILFEEARTTQKLIRGLLRYLNT